MHAVPGQITHGMSRTGTYGAWFNAKRRCLNKKCEFYPRYGGRGITFCKRWLKFENFFEDMGVRPVGKSLDRIDNDKGYKPSNCRWATSRQQMRNRRNSLCLSLNGRTEPLIVWAEECGISYEAMWNRIFVHKWEVSRAVTEPSQYAKKKLRRNRK